MIHAAKWKADGVAKLLIEAGANLDAKNRVRPEGLHMYICVTAGWLVGGRAVRAVSINAACMHACAEVQ